MEFPILQAMNSIFYTWMITPRSWQLSFVMITI